ATRVGQRAGERGEREQGGPGEEHAAAPEQVGGAPTEHEEAGEGEGVGVDDPLEAGRGEAQPAADLGQGDVDDRDVEDDHELREAHDEQKRCPVADFFGGGGGGG